MTRPSEVRMLRQHLDLLLDPLVDHDGDTRGVLIDLVVVEDSVPVVECAKGDPSILTCPYPGAPAQRGSTALCETG